MYVLDLAAKLDQTAGYVCQNIWGEIEFPAPFGRPLLPEEKYAHVLLSSPQTINRVW